MRFAYADPPYLGAASRLYGPHHPEAAEYDEFATHAELIGHLIEDFPDGWALSLHVPSLRVLLPLCPDDVRVCPWVKGWCSWKPGVSPAYAWEPVILRGGRQRPAFKTRDWVMANASSRQPNHVPGQKPVAFCQWILQILGYEDGDELVDLFPGSGVMTRVLAQGVLL